MKLGSNTKFPLLFIAAAVSLVYLNSFRGVFQFDDYNVIVYNAKVHSLSAWLQDLPHGIRPLLKFTYMLNWGSGPGTFWFHLLNLLIHTANAALVYLLVLRFIRRYRSWRPEDTNIALLAALFFALHPAQTEAVTYVSGRSTSLMAMFYLGSTLAYIHGTEGKSRLWVLVVSPLLFIMAVLTKETAVTLPLALLLWEGATRAPSMERPKIRIALRMQAVHWTMLIFILVIIIAHPNYGKLLEYSFDIRHYRDNLLSQINGVTYLLSKLLIINRLNIDPDLPVLTNWTFLLALKATFLISLILTGIVSLKRMPWLGFGLLWFVLHLLPTNSVVPRLDVANDRQLYLPIFGIFLILSIGIARVREALKGRNGFLRAGTAVLLIILGCSTVARNHTYRSEIALWEDTQLKSPRKARVYNNLGCAYAFAGKNEEAKRAYRTALSLNPDYPLARSNLASISGPKPPMNPKAERE
jgi:protein O-mannosyl-transferase